MVLKTFNTGGGLRPEVRPLTLLYTIFGRKDTPFVYFQLINATHFVYLPLKNITPFTNLLKNTESHAAFNKLKQYSHKVCVCEIF